MSNESEVDKAVRKLTAEQVAGILSGSIAVAPGVAESVRRIHGQPAAAVVVPPDVKRRENAAWLAGEDAYDDARARAEAAGASADTLNALLSPGLIGLPCGLSMLPMTLAGYVFLEAVDAAWVSGAAPGPSDLLYGAMAVISPERCAAVVSFDEDFRPRADRARMEALAREVGAQVTTADVPHILQHLARQINTMFPKAPVATTTESEGSDPLAAEAQAAGA